MSAAKLLFAGTPEFALASLAALYEAGFVPQAVLTQPDRPAGRGKKLTASPVKVFAADKGIDVWQPATLRDPDVIAQIAAADPDIIVVAAYGLLLPRAVLDIPERGCLNVHASLLPRWARRSADSAGNSRGRRTDRHQFDADGRGAGHGAGVCNQGNHNR